MVTTHNERNKTLPSRQGWLAPILPGVLVAATGVGAGDLMTGALGGSAIGLALLWAALVGAILKWFLNEGLARWQMATGTTLLEGWVTRLGPWIQWVFLGYLVIWSVFTGGALISACGVAGSAWYTFGADAATSKMIWGATHSLVGLALVLGGGFKLFEKVMAACIGVMFVTVLATAVLVQPDWSAVLGGITTPSLPTGGRIWVLGLLGGVGGTVTLLSYGYWIGEQNRVAGTGLRACRIDLGIGYGMTATFGIAMVIVGSATHITKGNRVALDLASQLAEVVGPIGRWIFLVGFWGAVFSSLLGVWQSIPYMFADFVRLRRRTRARSEAPTTTIDSDTTRGSGTPVARTAPDLPFAADAPIELRKTGSYRAYLLFQAIAPLPLLALDVTHVQLLYAVLGSLFMPLLAVTLLVMNNRTAWVGKRFRNGIIANAGLIATLALFAYIAGDTVLKKLDQWRHIGDTLG